ncbi:hypothetical protein DYB32_001315 [Aphanomyces invadans]|uniref:SET domain-containing protein n=1 Tax=Aphanomyces invadans TaxID=157072 RepID=A0A418B6Z2_9STRA|nr:hypothetical protein DYB32_001315 [Aphanomyces invadans]
MARAASEQRFMQWLVEHGAKVDALRISSDVSGSRGVVATREIAENEVSIVIPSSLFISEVTAKADPTLGPIFAANMDLFTRDDPLLSTFLTYHIYLQDASFFHPYLAILPPPESILNWSSDDLAELQHPYDAQMHDVFVDGMSRRQLVDVATRRNHEIHSWYDRITARLFRLHSVSRRLPWTSLVPFADCLNHANVATRYDFDVDGNGCFRWHSSQRHAPRQQVFNSYGRRPNQTLLLDYGFALPRNEWDFVDFDIDAIEFSLPKPERRRLFLAAHLMPFPSRLRFSPDTTLNEVLPYYRCASLVAASTNTSILEPQHPVVEMRALMRLRDQLQHHLAALPTTIDQDSAMLDANDMTDTHRTAVVYRWHRKFILHRVLEMTTEQLKTFNRPEDDAVAR